MPEETSGVEVGSQSSSTEQSFVQEPGSQVSGENEGEGSSSSASGQQNLDGQKPKESRYERTKRERAEFRQQQRQFQLERQAFVNERAKFEQEKNPPRNYTLADLKRYREQWRDSGDYKLVEKADQEIATMEAEAAQRTVEIPPLGTAEHAQQWHSAERELFQTDPEFRPGSGNRLDKVLSQLMQGEDGNIYRQHPRGIVAAYHRARMELLKADNGVLQTENSKLKAELQRLTGLTSIDGGAIGQMGNGRNTPFEKLSSKDMRRRLMQSAQRDGVPWF